MCRNCALKKMGQLIWFCLKSRRDIIEICLTSRNWAWYQSQVLNAKQINMSWPNGAVLNGVIVLYYYYVTWENYKKTWLGCIQVWTMELSSGELVTRFCNTYKPNLPISNLTFTTMGIFTKSQPAPWMNLFHVSLSVKMACVIDNLS